ncbi:MAG: hypothetical protein SEPTF4163_005690 [Sporothrix epigloea]
MFSTLNLVKALPFALMLSTALANPVPDASSGSDLGERTIGNDATFLYCVTSDYECGISATYTSGDTQRTVSWTAGSPASDAQAVQVNMDSCFVELYKKHTNDAGFWLDVGFSWGGVSHTIGYNPTGDSIDLGDASWSSTDGDYLNVRCLAEFGSDFSSVSTDNGSVELNWTDLNQTLY